MLQKLFPKWFSQFHCCFREIFINRFLRLLTFSHFEEPCVCLRDVKNLQTTVHGFDLFLWNLPMRWQQSILMSSVISNLFLIIFLTSSSQLPHVSFDVSGMPSVRTLFCRYLSSSCATSAWRKCDLKDHLLFLSG